MSGRYEGDGPESILEVLPPDLAFITVSTVLIAAFLAGTTPAEPFLRLVVALPLFILFPGYCIVAALFPERQESLSTSGNTVANNSLNNGQKLSHRAITPLERFAMSVGVSIVVVPLLGILLNVSLSGLSGISITLSLTALILITAGVAGWRRATLAKQKRFQVPYRVWAARLFEPGSRRTIAYNLVLVVAFVTLIGSFTYATTTPSEEFTELYLLSENESGELVAHNYPEELTRGAPETLFLGVENQEKASVSYTVVIQLQEVDRENNQVIRTRELKRLNLDLSSGETRVERHSITPSISGESLRLTYLLYLDDPPENPRSSTAYRQVYIWVDVS